MQMVNNACTSSVQGKASYRPLLSLNIFSAHIAKSASIVELRERPRLLSQIIFSASWMTSFSKIEFPKLTVLNFRLIAFGRFITFTHFGDLFHLWRHSEHQRGFHLNEKLYFVPISPNFWQKTFGDIKPLRGFLFYFGRLTSKNELPNSYLDRRYFEYCRISLLIKTLRLFRN
jgi:hypothetical protein